MQIRNKEGVACSRGRGQMLELFESGINSCVPGELIPPALSYNRRLNSLTIVKNAYHLVTGRIFVVGGGKASGSMAEEVECIIGADNITAGVVNSVKGDFNTEKIKVNIAGHPLPDKDGVRGVGDMFDLKTDYEINDRDLVICLVSGGGSALLPYPVGRIKLKEKRKTTELLIRSGAPIGDINIVRKHISGVKGGRLGQYFAPARVAALIISDVADNDLNIIASGPTATDPSTYRDAYYVLEKYSLLEQVPDSVKAHILRGCDGKELETPKVLSNCDNYIIGKNAIALEDMAMGARGLGYRPLILTYDLEGDPSEAADKLANEIKLGKYDNYDLLILGGETTPKVGKSHGQGGRNQHFVAAAMMSMSDYDGDWLVGSMSSDGSDFIPEVAGALADRHTIEYIKDKDINVIKYLDSFNTFDLFKKTGREHIVSGPTGTNVGDLMLLYFEKK